MANRCRAPLAGVAIVYCALVPSIASGSLVVSAAGSGFGSPGLKSAEVEFAVSGSNLLVTLTNTGPNDVLVPADVLTAVFFDVSGQSLALTPVSGYLAGGSVVYYDPNGQPPGGDIGGEWAYRSGINNGPTSASYGISSVGLDIFGPGDLFPGANLSGPTSPDGLQYGLLPAADDPMTGNGGVTGSGGLINNSVVMTLSGLPDNFDLGRIGNVYFLYGTSIDEGGFTPTPGAAVLAGVAGIALGLRRRR